MTAGERYAILMDERYIVTKERLGFGCDAHWLTAEALEADVAEAQRRMTARGLYAPAA